MPTLRTIRKGSTAGGVSSEDTDTDVQPTVATANNKTIDLFDGADDDEEDVEVIEIVCPAQKHSSNKQNKRKKAPATKPKHGLKGTKTNKKKTISVARPRNDEEREHSKAQNSMWGYVSLPRGPKIKEPRPEMVAPPLESIPEDEEAPLILNPGKTSGNGCSS